MLQKTRAGPAIKFLKSFGLKLAFDNENLITRFGMDRVNLAVPDQVSWISHYPDSWWKCIAYNSPLFVIISNILGICLSH